ncbi:MAG: SMP-30/gluconolactonase/LRE family protein [Pseudomonadota bacterium]
MNIQRYLLLIATVCLLLFIIERLAPGGIQAQAWQPKPAPALTGTWQGNDRLDDATAEQRGLDGPDTVIVGPDRMRYTGVGDGRILRWRDGEAPQTFVKLDGRPVGMNFGPDGTLYVADEVRAVIWAVSPAGSAKILVDRIGARRFRFINDVYIADDQRLYFTESTRRWGLAENRRALIEHGGDGGVFLRHPDGRVEQVLDGLEFANGVVLASDESYLLVAETGAYRITRLWLKGPRAGQRETLLDNLPGFPGDLSVAPDGSYWGSFFSPRNNLLDRLAAKPYLRRLLARLPLSLLPQAKPYPFVFRFDGEGRVLETLQDSRESQRPSFSSVVQHGDELLMGTPGGVGAIDADTVWQLRLPAKSKQKR